MQVCVDEVRALPGKLMEYVHLYGGDSDGCEIGSGVDRKSRHLGLKKGERIGGDSMSIARGL